MLRYTDLDIDQQSREKKETINFKEDKGWVYGRFLNEEWGRNNTTIITKIKKKFKKKYKSDNSMKQNKR